MKKKPAILITLCVLIGSMLFGCKTKEQPAAETPTPAPGSGASITFVNGVEEADVWILPETEANLKTTLWGTATIAKLATDASCEVSLDALGGPGVYILRLIDTRGMYYAVNGVPLAPGDIVQIRSGEVPMSALVEVTGADGALRETFEVFAARL